eukprot:CAMPEP_0117446252 /NCGR_PEP_ID=MMETSP0759-20121206/6235_1 /TAXON_ID=63605 /ORGANISM="Percolomonas cosmopolitus, Strain WS" /LENGTH=812 /DNA_ID=CAMNT_0005238493 /DNA_START=858 /DNA_END=3292 /DNA_ORIENTATION=-
MTFYSLFPSQQFFPQSYFNSKNAGANGPQDSSKAAAANGGGSPRAHHSNRNSSVSHGRITSMSGQGTREHTVIPPSQQLFHTSGEHQHQMHQMPHPNGPMGAHAANAYSSVPPSQMAMSRMNKHHSTDSTNSVQNTLSASHQHRSSADLNNSSNNALNLIEKLELWNLNSKNKRDSSGSLSSARSSLSMDESWSVASYSGNTSGSSDATGNRMSNSSVTSVLSDNPMARGNRSSLDSNASYDFFAPPQSTVNTSAGSISPHSSASYAGRPFPSHHHAESSEITSPRLSREFEDSHISADFYNDAHFAGGGGHVPLPHHTTSMPPTVSVPPLDQGPYALQHNMPPPPHRSQYTPLTPRSSAAAAGMNAPSSWTAHLSNPTTPFPSSKFPQSDSDPLHISSARSSIDLSNNRIYDNTNVFVKHLPPFLDDDQLRAYFQPFGEITSCKVMLNVKTGASLGFGFVRFQDPHSAQKAIDKMTGYRIGKKKLLCKLSNKALPPHSVVEPRSNLYVKHLPVSYDNQKLRVLFERFGKIKEVKVMMDKHTGLSKQIGFVRFERQVDATTALQELNNILLDEDGSVTPLNIHYAETSTEKRMRQVQQQARLSISQQFLANQQPPKSGTTGSADAGSGTITSEAVVPFSKEDSSSSSSLIPAADSTAAVAAKVARTHSSSSRSRNDDTGTTRDGAESPSRHLSSPTEPVASLDHRKYPSTIQKNTMPSLAGGVSDAITAQIEMRRKTRAMSSSSSGGSDDQKANLFIFHLPQDITDSELYTLFSPFGAVESVRVITDLNGQSRGFGFVKYTQFSDALKAITA